MRRKHRELGEHPSPPVAVAKHGCCVDKSCDSSTCMKLPDGITCKDCWHVERCVSIFGQKSTDDYCQWFPRRFTLPFDLAGKDRETDDE